jgi:hypothetical protein
MVARSRAVLLVAVGGNVAMHAFDHHRCCACRCRGLEALTLNICSVVFTADGEDGTAVLELHLAGQGTNPSDRVASLQAQLAAFRTTPTFLHSANWHLLQPCLTSLAFRPPWPGAQGECNLPTIVTSPLHLLQVPSLRSLKVNFSTLPASLREEQQALVSNLLHLTHLAGTVADSNGLPMDSFWSHAASLPLLHSLEVAGKPFSRAEAFTIPRSWRSCSSLTSLIFSRDITSLANLSCLQSLPCLQSLKLACAPADLAHLRRLVHLTLLDVTCTKRAAAGQQQAQGAQQQPAAEQGAAGAAQGAEAAAGAAQGAEAAAAAAAAAAENWACSDNLLKLRWWCHLEAAPLQHLTSLNRLHLIALDAERLPDSLLAPLVELQQLQELKLWNVQLTPDLCW